LYRQFAWELEAGLVCMTIGSLMWIRPALDGGSFGGVGRPAPNEAGVKVRRVRMCESGEE
jgi:hypothetical protein